jgi:hypothetical protein
MNSRIHSCIERRNVHVRTKFWTKHSDWTAEFDGWEPGDPIGHGQTEADAVYDLFCAIDEREQNDQERHDTEMGIQS